MGCRSEIRLVLAKEIVDGANLLELEFPEMIKESDWVTEDGNRFIYGWHSIKFYDSYAYVTEFRKFINDLEMNEGPFSLLVAEHSQDFYQFFRLGEDYGDYESQGDMWTFHPDHTIGINYDSN